MLRPRVLFAMIASLAVLALGGLYQRYVLSDEPPAAPVAEEPVAPAAEEPAAPAAEDPATP
jgi:hypothetical protein